MLKFQERRFTFVFSLYADSKGTVDANALVSVLSHIGPPIPVEGCAEIIQQYDKRQKNSLDLYDFLELMADYAMVRRDKLHELKESAKEMSTGRGLEFPSASRDVQIDGIVKNSGLGNGDGLWVTGERFKELKSQKYITKNDPIINRVFSVYVSNAENVPLRTKISKEGIVLKGAHIFVRVGCCGVWKEIRAYQTFDGSVEFDERVLIDILLPHGNLMAVRDWIEKQNIEFYLCDYQKFGENETHRERVGYYSVPLAKVLIGRKPSLTLCMKLNREFEEGENDEIPSLTVTLSDEMKDDFSFAYVADAYIDHENGKTIEQSLLLRKCDINFETGEIAEPVMSNEEILSLYDVTKPALKEILPHREFNFLCIDENENLRLLPAMVCPLIIPDLEDPLALLEMVSSNNKKGSWSKCKADFVSFQDFCASPELLLTRSSGNALEYSILLCSLLIASELDAYVALGFSNGRKAACVVTFEAEKVGTQEELSYLIGSLSRSNSSDIEEKLKFHQNTRVSLWDTSAGIIHSHNDESILFESIDTIFNDQNIWLNVQRVNELKRIQFSWDMTKTDAWVPFLSKSLERIEPTCNL